jgi:hypothetical protein
MPRERLLIGSDVGCYLGLAAVYAATQHRDGSRDNTRGAAGLSQIQVGSGLWSPGISTILTLKYRNRHPRTLHVH